LCRRQSLRLGQYFAERGLKFDAILIGTLRRHAQTLDSLLTQDTATGGDKWLDSSWKGAEAYH
jgi:phosphohistidine phosphatase SixA